MTFWLNFFKRKIEAGKSRLSSQSSLSRDEKDVQSRAWIYLEQNCEQLVRDYLSINGNNLDADRAKDLFPEYAANLKARSRYASAVYEPAQQLVDRVFLNRIRSNIAGERVVVFTAGGPGSGKSSFMFTLEEQFEDALVVMDGTLADQARAEKNIDLALRHGCLVAVYYMHRGFEDCINGVIDRALSPTSGRTVPMRVVAVKFYGAIHTVQFLARRYRTESRFLLEIKKFVGIGNSPEACTLGEVIGATPNSLDQLIRKAYRLLHDRYDSAQGRGEEFPKEIYDRLASHAPSFKGPRR